MTAIPAKSDFTGTSVTEGEFKTALETLHDYLTGQLGSAGTQAAAQSALGALIGAGVAMRSAAYTVVAADRGKMILCSGSFTLSLTAAAVLSAGFSVAVVNVGTSAILIDPSGSETVSGKATLTLSAGSSVILACDGSAWQIVGANTSSVKKGYELFTASGYFTPQDGVTRVKATVIGGGGGGGAGWEYYDNNSGAYIQVPGGNGGSGGQWISYVDVTPGVPMQVIVGAGGAGSNTGNGAAGATTTIPGVWAAGGNGGLQATSTVPGADGAAGAVASGNLGKGYLGYAQTTRERASGASAAVSYTATGAYCPGAGGQGEMGSSSNTAAGGVGGLVLIEW